MGAALMRPEKTAEIGCLMASPLGLASATKHPEEDPLGPGPGLELPALFAWLEAMFADQDKLQIS